MERALAAAHGVVVIASDARLCISRMQHVAKSMGYAERLRFRRSPDDESEVWIIKTAPQAQGAADHG